MKTGEIIQRVQSLYSKGVESDDTRLSDRHIYSKMLSTRSLLIYRKSNKHQNISSWNYQVLPCVKMIKANPNECPCAPPPGCKILRSKDRIPDPINNIDSEIITSVTSMDGSVIYSPITWKEYKYKHARKYTASKPDYFVRDKFIYITHRFGPKFISIEGLFEDPLKVYNYPSCEGKTNCNDPYNIEFPIDNDLTDPLVHLCVEELVSTFYKTLEDTDNNSSDDTNKIAKR